MSLFEGDTEREITLGGDLTPETEEQLLRCLRKNADVFAWSAEDIPGVSRQITEHHLNIYAGSNPLKQRLRKASLERQEIIKEEVAKLLKAGIL